MLAAHQLGLFAGLASLLVGFAPFVLSRRTLKLTTTGVRVGLSWSTETPWHQVRAIEWTQGVGGAAHVVVRTTDGASSASVPDALVPALRALARRQGRLELAEGAPDVRRSYERMVAPTQMLSWALLLGTGALMPWAADPWNALFWGLLSACAVATLSASIAARLDGWGTGAILWLGVLYTLVLSAIGAVARGWLS
jgi:hypothetical protein